MCTPCQPAGDSPTALCHGFTVGAGGYSPAGIGATAPPCLAADVARSQAVRVAQACGLLCRAPARQAGQQGTAFCDSTPVPGRAGQPSVLQAVRQLRGPGERSEQAVKWPATMHLIRRAQSSDCCQPARLECRMARTACAFVLQACMAQVPGSLAGSGTAGPAMQRSSPARGCATARQWSLRRLTGLGCHARG